MPGDVIVQVDEADVGSFNDLYTILDGRHPGETITLTVLRDKQRRTVEVILYELPRR
jgi:S1-C subfamily serine protease